MFGQKRAIGFVFFLALAVGGCDEPLVPGLASLEVFPETMTLDIGETEPISIFVRGKDGNRIEVGYSISWASTAPSVADVSALGSVTGMTPGAAGIVGTATVQGFSETFSDTLPVVVMGTVPVVVDSVDVTPPVFSMTVGASQPLTASAFDASGAQVSAGPPAWSSANQSVAAVTQQGVVTGVGVGSTWVLGTLGGVTDSAQVTVNSTIGPVDSIAVTPPSASVSQGGTQQYTATAFDAQNNVIGGVPQSWSTRSSSVATVNNQGVATGTGVGSTYVLVTMQGVTDSAAITVTAPSITVATVTVTPSTANVFVGGTQQYSATAFDSQGNVITGQAITWATGNGSIGSISAGGLLTGGSAGSTSVDATIQGITGSATVTVTTPGAQICEAQGGGQCFYVALSGNDNSGTGSFANPWRTPAKARSSLGANDYLYLRGGTYTAASGQPAIIYHTLDVPGAASGARITYKAYPGELVILDGQAAGVTGLDGQQYLVLLEGDGARVVGFEIRNHTSSGVSTNGPTRYHEITDNYIHGGKGTGTGTNGGVRDIDGMQFVDIHHNTFSDNLNVASTGSNVAGIIMAQGGQGVKIHHNLFFTTVDRGQADIRHKRGATNGRVEIYNNVFINSQNWIYSTVGSESKNGDVGFGTDFHHNLAIGSGDIEIGYFSYIPSDNVVQYNTIITDNNIAFNMTQGSLNNRIEHNIVYQNNNNFDSNQGFGTMRICHYCSQSEYSSQAGTHLINNNRYFNAGSDGFQASWWGVGNASNGLVYTSLSAWQASGERHVQSNTPHDRDSQTGNPQFVNANGTLSGNYTALGDSNRGAYAGSVNQRLPSDLTTIGSQRHKPTVPLPSIIVPPAPPPGN